MTIDDQKSFAEMRHERRRNLLLEIARCPDVALALKDKSHACHFVVKAQPCEVRHLPEPWSGSMEAPILFISSNPSYGCDEVNPTATWPDDDVWDFYEHRFGRGKAEWTRDTLRTLSTDGKYSRVVSFWRWVRDLAVELLQRDPVPGVDYAMSEVVHCKSANEEGVYEASTHCAQLYLRRVLEAAGAVVFVVLGRHAENAVRQELGVANAIALAGPMEVGAKERHVAFLPHPAAYKPRTFAACMPTELEHLRSILRQT